MSIVFKLNEKLYLRDPQETDLGRRIIEQGILLIDKLGFEDFTFRKLAEGIGSTEASIYRYFENKHRLLLYLTAWYWNWTEFRIDLLTHPSQSPADKLRWCLRVLSELKENDPAFGFVNEQALYRIVLNEQDKTYLTKWVDTDNQKGLFGGYKSICRKIAGMISELDPTFAHPSSLASTIMSASIQQLFYSEHLPSLTNIHGMDHEALYKFLEDLTFGSLKTKSDA